MLNRALYKPAFISFIIFISVFCYLSCGLEDIPFIDYIPASDMNDVSWARINLPPDTTYGYEPPPIGYFVRFEIYYRIYISGLPLNAIIDTSDLRSQINGALNSDFNYLSYYTDKTSNTVNPSNLDITFSNRKYYKLTLKEPNNNDNYIDSILNRTNSLGKTLEIRFWQENDKEPELIINGAPYTLQRARLFDPAPDRNFLNSSQINDPDNVKNGRNADVAVPNNEQDFPRYTYVSMYIFAVGKDYLSTIYSQPTHIGIFRLAEAN